MRHSSLVTSRSNRRTRKIYSTGGYVFNKLDTSLSYLLTKALEKQRASASQETGRERRSSVDLSPVQIRSEVP